MRGRGKTAAAPKHLNNCRVGRRRGSGRDLAKWALGASAMGGRGQMEIF